MTEGWKESENRAELTKIVSKPIKTLEELVKVCEIDTETWAIDRYECTAWTTTMKVRRKDRDDEVRKEQNYRVSAKLTRRVAKQIQDATARLIDRIKEHSPKYGKPPARPSHDNPHLLELICTDLHIGKLAWSEETGQNYDVKIAERVYHAAVDNLLARGSVFGVDRIILPIGSDFFHVNGLSHTTINGTPQDVDGRWAKVFDCGCAAIIKAVEKCVAVAPVEVIWIPGNHDFESSRYAAKVIEARFWNCPDVKVDCSPKTRKYVHYGAALIGLAHGDCEKASSLPTIMAGEAPEAWANSKQRAWHVGHFHKHKQTVYNAGDTFDGVTVSVIRSLSSADAWHYRSGYVNGTRAAEAYLWSKEGGYAGHFSYNAPASLYA